MEEVWKGIPLADLLRGQRMSKEPPAPGHPYKTALGASPPSAAPPAAATEGIATPPLAVPCSNSGLEFQLLGAPQDAAGASNHHSSSSLVSPASPAAAVAAGLVSLDRQSRKLIKNREFAARSRARKQAYTNELELEVANLKEENAKLRMQHKELCLAMASQLSKRTQLQRSSTAPF